MDNREDGEVPMKKYRLKKDIIIPAGTIFKTAPRKTERFDDDVVDAIFALTDDTAGICEYAVDWGDPKIGEFFEEV